LYLDAETARTPEGLASPTRRFLERGPGVVFIGTPDPLQGLDQPTVVIETTRATPSEQREAWASSLGQAAGDNPALLAGQFTLDLATTGQIARAVLAGGQADSQPLREQLWQACLARTRPRLEGLAERLAVKAGWNDLVVPAAEAEMLRRIAEQVRCR